MSFRSAFALALATVLWLGGCATQVPTAPSVSTAAAPAPASGEGPAEDGELQPPAVREPWAPAVVEALPEREFERGRASWYGKPFHGRRTASGETFNMNDFTAAHKTLPFGTRVWVRNLSTEQEVLVRINDRGPHVRGRIIDLSRAAAAQIGLLKTGVASIALLRD